MPLFSCSNGRAGWIAIVAMLVGVTIAFEVAKEHLEHTTPPMYEPVLQVQ